MSLGDVVDDMRIPLNDTVHTQRYRDAVPMMQGVDIVVGHSLGGAVALSKHNIFAFIQSHMQHPSLILTPLILKATTDTGTLEIPWLFWI